MEHRFLFLLFLISFVLRESSSECPARKDAEVLIFGAGTAGVTAARVLNDHKLSFKVLEAYDKIGGRIRNIPFNDVQIEVGANWIHEAPVAMTGSSSGANNAAPINPIWTLAHACNVDGVEESSLQGGFTESSIFLDLNNETQQYVTVNAREIEMDYMMKYEEALKTNGTNTVREGLDSNDWHPDSALKQLIEWSEFDFTYAATPDESVVSLTAANDDVNFGEQCFIVTDQRGFASVLQCIANFSHQDKILTNTNVTSIELYDECVCAEVMGQGRMCGDYGIVTFSIGVLQKWIKDNKFKGNMSLSSQKKNAINKSRMGLYLKIFVRFPNVFWNTSASYTYATNTKRGYYPVLQPIGASLPGSPPIILMTVTGDEAMRISNSSKDEVKQEVVAVLREWYNNDNIPEITNNDIEYYDWNTNEFFLGMFSNNPTTLTINDKRNLAIPEGRLYFSGEANSIEHGGTIHGAYCSGMDAATKILTAKGMYNEGSNSLPKCSTSPGCYREPSSKKQTCPPSGTTPTTIPSSAKSWYVSTFTLASILLTVLLVCGV